MAPGGTDDDTPAGRRPLPPDDRVWRHPAEVAHARRRHRRRRRVRRTLATSGAAVAAGAVLLWVGGEPSGQPLGAGERADAELVAMAMGDGPAVTVLASNGWADDVASRVRVDTVTIRANSGTETLAHALVVDPSGYLITSARALGGQREVLVVWAEGVMTATVIGHDATTDVSVLATDTTIPSEVLADAPPPESGATLVMVEPDGGSETRRVVSPVSASSTDDGQAIVGIVELEGALDDLLPGTPAVDRDGDVVGIASATAATAPAAVVPIELARGVADEIIRDGVASHPWIGVTARDITADDEDPTPGAYVTALDSDGPAAQGGVEQGDLIVEVGGVTVTTSAEMVAALRRHEPGEVISILVRRGGEPVSCSVELSSHPDVAG